jgi:hypothetical protein
MISSTGMSLAGIAGDVLQRSKGAPETIPLEAILPDVDIVCTVADMADLTPGQVLSTP